MSEQFLDLRAQDLDLDGVLKAIQTERYVRFCENRELAGIVITSGQESAFIAEWKAAQVSEPPPEALGGGTLWGQPVRVLARDDAP